MKELTITEQMKADEKERLAASENSHKRALALFSILKNLTIYKNGEVR